MNKSKNQILTVVIPAHNEEGVILYALTPYKKFVESGCLRLMVICNACTDKTFDVAKSVQFAEVYDEQKKGKFNAINFALSKVENSHVFVQDADTHVDELSVNNLIDFINKNDFGLASPIPRYMDSKSYLVRKYYEFLYLTPAYLKGMVGAGSYLINSCLIPKIWPLPEIIADDGYVKFKLQNYKFDKISNVFISIKQPNDIYSLLKIKTRSRLGNIGLQGLVNTDVKEHRNSFDALISTARENNKYISALVYFALNLLARIRAGSQIKSKKIVWERDDSTRCL